MKRRGFFVRLTGVAAGFLGVPITAGAASFTTTRQVAKSVLQICGKLPDRHVIASQDEQFLPFRRVVDLLALNPMVDSPICGTNSACRSVARHFHRKSRLPTFRAGMLGCLAMRRAF